VITGIAQILWQNRDMIAGLLLFTAGRANGPDQVLAVQRQNGVHRYSIRLETGPFQRHGRKLVWVPLDVKRDAFLPGYRRGHRSIVFWHGYEPVGYTRAEIAHGSAWSVLKKRSEIRSLNVTVDGQRWKVQERLFRDLLDPHALKYQLLTTLAPDGKTLWIRNKGSVHGSAYWVMWILHKDGRQNRVDDDGPRYLGD